MKETKPGDKLTYDGVNYYAVPGDGLCDGCAFDSDKPAFTRCDETPCDGIVWLTKPDYIIHRLTS